MNEQREAELARSAGRRLRDSDAEVEPSAGTPRAGPAGGRLEGRSIAEPYAVAVVVRVDRPVSAHAGDRAVVTADGRLSGWVGGSCAEPVVVREALAALADRRPRLVRIRPAGDRAGSALAEEPGVVTELTTCASEGGLDVFVEPRLPAAKLLIAGSSPAARALAALAGALGEHVTAVVDSDHETLPGASATVAVGALADAGLHETDAVVVATMNRYDEPALRAALATGAGYVGLIASRRRGRKTLALLADEGVPAADLERVATPAGLDLGPSTQEEIALAVLAEIVAWRHRHAPAGATQGGPPPAGVPPGGGGAGGGDAAGGAGEAGAADAPGAATITGDRAGTGGARAAPATATDPVCGMSVAVTPAAVTTEVDGERYWFCAPGCRDAFLSDPGRYTGAAASGG